MDQRIESDEVKIRDLTNNALLQFRNDLDADIFVISGTISRELADRVIDQLSDIKAKRPNAAVFLCTYGGEGDAAYIIARTFQRQYDRFILFVSGYCKSAGTLIALGASEIALASKGELGPLDVQLLREDNIVFRTSGLDISRAIESLRQEAFRIFEESLLQLISRSGGTITTKTAAHMATELAIGLLSPITAQIDPIKIGEIEGAMQVAYQYGVRLGASETSVRRLTHDYPSHSFVIDLQEAKDIFKSVRSFNDAELLVEKALQIMLLGSEQAECLREPHPGSYIAHIKPEEPQQERSELDEKPKQKARSTNSKPEAGNGSG